MTDHKQNTINNYLEVQSWFREVFVNEIEKHRQLNTELHYILSEVSKTFHNQVYNLKLNTRTKKFLKHNKNFLKLTISDAKNI